MDLKITPRATNGHARRHYPSWIEKFVEITKGLESAPIYRRWAAIATIGAVLQQKVWVNLQGVTYPNVYVFLIGNASLGKSRPINEVEKILRNLDDVARSPTSTTMASLVDKIVDSHRVIPLHPGPAIAYNSLFVIADELSTFMNDFKGQNDLIAGLTKFWDCSPYSQSRRIHKIDINIEHPQLTILSGSTQSNLMHFIPEWAWEQGFTSRIMLIYANERFPINPFDEPPLIHPPELIDDLQEIDTIVGEMKWTTEYKEAMMAWRESGMEPAQNHPRLIGYNGRRWHHLIKLTMIASIDRSNDLQLTLADYQRAKKWLLEAESCMPQIFHTAATSADSKVIDDIHHYILTFGEKGVPEHIVKNYARGVVNTHAIMPTIEIMIGSELIKVKGYDKIGSRIFEGVKINAN